MAKPEEITFEVTNKCNNKCLHCSTEAGPEGTKELTIKQITDMCDYYRPNWANISGGEALLHPKIFEIIKHIKKRRIRIRLYTCGNIETRYIDKALSLGVNKIIFGIESINPQTHDYITGVPGSFNTTMANLKYTILRGHHPQVHLVPMMSNQDELELSIQKLKDLGVERVSLLRLVVQGRAKENKHIIPDNKILDTVNELKEKYGEFVRLGSPYDYSIPCSAGIGKLVVTSDYKVTPCETFKSGKCYCARANKDGLEMSLKLHSLSEQYDLDNKNIGIQWGENKTFLVKPVVKNMIPQHNNISSWFRR